jgi:protein-S-isoprenylcysteine O-methyltransferase Ste14
MSARRGVRALSFWWIRVLLVKITVYRAICSAQPIYSFFAAACLISSWEAETQAVADEYLRRAYALLILQAGWLLLWWLWRALARKLAVSEEDVFGELIK